MARALAREHSRSQLGCDEKKGADWLPFLSNGKPFNVVFVY